MFMSKQTSKILIVEDETALRDLYTTLLQKQGHRVTAAEDGKVALEIMKKETFDLVLLDIMLPEIDGLGVLNEITEDAAYKHQHLSSIVMLTNLSHDQVVSQAIAKGVRGYLVKSDYDPQQFIAAIDEIIGTGR